MGKEMEKAEIDLKKHRIECREINEGMYSFDESVERKVFLFVGLFKCFCLLACLRVG